MASADSSSRFAPSPFQASDEVSPGKNALLHCTTAGSTPLRFDHKSFAVSCPLTLLSRAFYPILVHRLTISLHTSSPRSVALPQLCFASFAVVSLRRDLHPQECAHAGRTKKAAPKCGLMAGSLVPAISDVAVLTTSKPQYTNPTRRHPRSANTRQRPQMRNDDPV